MAFNLALRIFAYIFYKKFSSNPLLPERLLLGLVDYLLWFLLAKAICNVLSVHLPLYCCKEPTLLFIKG